MSRGKAAAIHALITIIIVLAIGGPLFRVWYPSPYFHAGGADKLALLLIGVELCVGPLLTLIVFRPGKRGLRFDAATIAVLQIAALLYGLWAAAASRPVFLVAAVDRFTVVPAVDVTDEDLARGSQPEFRSRSWTGPRLVALVLPTDPEERNELVFGKSGRNPEDLPRYYADYAQAGKTLLPLAKPLDVLRRKGPQTDALISAWLRESGRTEDGVRWVPLQARKADLVMFLDASTAQPLKALPIDPW